MGQNFEALQFCVCADLRYQMKEVLRKARREIFLETQMRQQPTQISAGQRTMPELRAAQEQNAMDFARCLLPSPDVQERAAELLRALPQAQEQEERARMAVERERRWPGTEAFTPELQILRTQ